MALVSNAWGTNTISTFAYTYDPAARRTARLDDGLTTNLFAYNLRSELTSAHMSTNLYAYTYDPLGRRTQRVDSGLTTNVFAYNPRSELTSALMGTNTYSYAYDPIGNRLFGAENGMTSFYAANELNQHTNAFAENSSPEYDVDGNMTTLGSWQLTWDVENRLVKASPRVLITGSRIYEYEYDYIGRRVKKTEQRHTMPASTWTIRAFAYDGWNLIRERVELDGAVSTHQYVWGLDVSGALGRGSGVGGLLALMRSDSTGTNNCSYCADGNYNISDMVDANENVVAHYEYSPCGETLAATEPMPASNPWRFSTRYYDTEIGLIMYPRRQYSPTLGRFLAKDPIWETGGVNLYGYTDNNFINRVDPFGLSCWNPFSWFDGSAENDCTRAGGSGTADKCCCKDNIFNPEDKCCENNQIVDKVKVYVINRSGGQRTGMTGGHIDLVVPGIGLIGFFGNANNPDDGSGRGIGWNIPGNLNIGEEWVKGSTTRLGYTLPPRVRLPNGADAQGNPIFTFNILSTICELKVCPANAQQMVTRAKQIDNDPGRFRIAGRNCSTMGCSILGAGGVMTGGISGIDNPQNLIDQLRDSGANCFTGYVYWNWQDNSFGQLPHDLNDIIVQATVQAPVAPTGSSR